MTRLTLIFLALFASLATAAEKSASISGQWTLQTLLDQRSQVVQHRALFTELRKSMEDGTTTSRSGVMVYEAPDRLERETARPFFERFVVEGEDVVIDIETEPGRRAQRQLHLKDVPALRPVLTGLRAVLSGDLTTLERHFNVQFNGTERRWRLTLVPIDVEFSRYVKRILMNGNGPEILAIETRTKNGDSIRTLLTSNLSERE